MDGKRSELSRGFLDGTNLAFEKMQKQMSYKEILKAYPPENPPHVDEFINIFVEQDRLEAEGYEVGLRFYLVGRPGSYQIVDRDGHRSSVLDEIAEAHKEHFKRMCERKSEHDPISRADL
jgi:hypothetical protein